MSTRRRPEAVVVGKLAHSLRRVRSLLSGERQLSVSPPSFGGFEPVLPAMMLDFDPETGEIKAVGQQPTACLLLRGDLALLGSIPS